MLLTQNPYKRKLPQLILAMVIGLSLAFGGGVIKHMGWGEQPVLAQYLRPEFVAEQVYIRLNYFPKENQYINKETGKVESDNTLINRLIRYHQDIKKRPTRFRIDWQLTLADYLGANEDIKEERYPGRSTLKNNPMKADIKTIKSLTRRQRKDLVDVLVSIYDVDVQQPSTSESGTSPLPQSTPESTSNPTPSSTPTPTTPTTPTKPRLSRPGDADLLLPQ